MTKIEVKTEIQVRELFFKYCEQLGWKVIQSQSRFPDYIIEGQSGNYYKAEVEYDFQNFIKHGHDSHKTDFIICWVDTCNKIPKEYFKKFGKDDFLIFPSTILLKEELEKKGLF